MKIVLTHEQADFDALGSMLGAHLLDESTLPLLPRRMNRNVRSFLTLYGSELPFIDVRDLPAGSIDTLTLVDTQGLITLKGITKKTHIHIVDHHDLRADNPPDWTVTSEQVGACTTLFVENLIEHNGLLNPIHATLMMLGIYEDTGSLTYASTTSRDVRAIANLLELGGSLRIASEYLNPSLSPEQRRLYDRLLEDVVTHTIHGQNVMIACSDGGDLTEEVSSVAHKLRDLLDPDALFLLVSTVEGIRIVARSTSDRINVAEIAAHFGGGGHERAASALVHPSAESEPGEQLAHTHQELLSILSDYIKPSITVGQIMSQHPLILSPQDSAEKAGKLMQRYGYEGYPVIENARVIGLLTRRAVDRALAHKLNLPVASLMDSGEVTVQAHETLDHLQNVMTVSNWGQVPVVNSDHAVIGIVTRTDLLKALATGDLHLPGKQNLAGRLENALPPARLALLKAIAAMAYEQHLAIYIVGGFVRDLILERPSLDFDVVIEGDAIALGRRLADKFGGRIVSHNRFGTSKWWIADSRAELASHLSEEAVFLPTDLPESLDLIGARTEFYDYPTALPTVERSNIKLDLHRRDFTINTMALRLDGRHYGELYDYWGGEKNLRKGLVKVLHSLSFVDDPTRMLRAVRFEQRFGFQIEARTVKLMEEARGLLRQVSGERLRHELDLVLGEDRPVATLSRMEELKLLASIQPQLFWKQKIAADVEAVLLADLDPNWPLPTSLGHIPLRRALAYLVWLGSLPPAAAISTAVCLRLNGELISCLRETFSILPDLPLLMSLTPSQVVRRLEPIPLAALYVPGHFFPSVEVRLVLSNYISNWRHVRPTVSGKTLLAFGIPPGPNFHHLLEALRAGRLDGKINSDEEELSFLHNLIREF